MKKAFLSIILIFTIFLMFGCEFESGNPDPTPTPTLEITEYTVDIFYDESVQSSLKIEENTYLSRPTDPVKSGYVFDDWYVDYMLTEVFDFAKPITGDLTIYGHFLKELNVSFANVEMNDQVVVEGNKLTKPNNPVKSGYVFEGWYVDSAFSTAYDFDTTLTTDLILYAKWSEEIYYTVTLDTLGGSPINAISVLSGSKIVLNSSPTKDGSIFGGWYIDSNCTTAWDFNTAVTANVTLYAKWTERSADATYYTVTFNSQGGTAVPSQELEEYAPVVEPADPTRDSYTFAGWYKDAACTQYYNFLVLNEVTSNMTLYAKWETSTSDTYTITFIYNNDQANLVTYTTGKINKPTDPIKTGYDFVGWYSDATCTTSWDFNTTITENTTLYAKWKIKTLTVSFEDCSASDQTINYGQTATQPADPTKDGYRFVGWYSNIDDEIVFDFDTEIYTDITITAGWIKTYTISFVSEYGSFDDIVVDENSKLPTLPTPTYSNQVFCGWYIGSTQVNQNSIVDSDITLTAKWEAYNLGTDNITLIDYSGYYEAAYVELEYVSGYTAAADYKVYYKLSSEQNYQAVDSELVRLGTSSIRCDILGLASGNYDILIEVGDKQRTIYNVSVIKYDREGYAHFNASSNVGAYKNDGTVMDDAVIVYVTEETKNTVTLTVNNKTYTGIANILQKQSTYKKPLIVRIIGTISAATWNTITYTKGNSNLTASQILDQYGNALPLTGMTEEEIIAGDYNSMSTDIGNGITKLNGLTNKITYKDGEFDSYYNMLDVASATNVTVEGVGTDAMLYQWGFTWSNCSYVEVRNLTFDDYTEDACSFQGAEESETIEGFSTGHIWIHHNTFNRGKNNWDVCPEQDKLSGDGATDLKKNAFITISYNHYYNCKKTGLVGGGDTQKTACISFHHNFYDQNGSRLPLGRQANMHMYNNYYYKNSSVMNLRAGAYAFVENCVFESCSSTVSLSNAAAKLYNNTFTSCSGVSGTKVTDRTTVVSNSNIYGSTFDTDSSIFYYDSTNQKTDVNFMLETDEVAAFCKKHSGVLKANFTPYSTDSSDNDNDSNTNDSNQDTETVTNTVVLTFNSFSTGSISTATTVNGITIYPKTGKTVTISSCSKTVAGTSITKYIALGGGSSEIDQLCIGFTTTKQANITVYYSSSTAGRYVNIMSSSEYVVATTPTESDSSIVNHTFSNLAAGTYSVASSNSGINIFCIVIEYLE